MGQIGGVGIMLKQRLARVLHGEELRQLLEIQHVVHPVAVWRQGVREHGWVEGLAETKCRPNYKTSCF